MQLQRYSLPPTNETWVKVIFLHLSVISFTGGACFPGGMHPCRGACVLPRGHACFQGGGCMLPGGTCFPGGGCACFPGGVCFLGWCVLPWGMHGCRGTCMVAGGCAWLQGGMHGCGGGVHGGGGACMGYDEIRSMSGRYASYWNAFLFMHLFVLS